jgi:hypothetical protein
LLPPERLSYTPRHVRERERRKEDGEAPFARPAHEGGGETAKARCEGAFRRQGQTRRVGQQCGLGQTGRFGQAGRPAKAHCLGPARL